ncbi:MAG: flagellar basal body rod protein FlgC [Pseudomonadota bacterium]
MSMFRIFDVASSGMTAQSTRLNVTASNVANAESVGTTPDSVYKARHPVFAAVRDQQLMQQSEITKVRVSDIIEDQTAGRQRYQPGHPMANDDGYIFASNVNPVEEMVNMLSASRSYESNIEMMNTAKQLLIRTISLGQ